MIRCKTLPNSRISAGTLESAAIFCADLKYSSASPCGCGAGRPKIQSKPFDFDLHCNRLFLHHLFPKRRYLL
jgi:hypothetical protein